MTWITAATSHENIMQKLRNEFCQDENLKQLTTVLVPDECEMFFP